jgi:response regulator NasT
MPIRIVIADDEPLTARQMRYEIERGDYEVVGMASTGTEALDLCIQHRPDLLLMDLRMPDMDGVAATTRIMSECPTPVVVVTGDPSLAGGAEQAGAVGRVMKPLTLERFSAVVELARARFAEVMSGRTDPDRQS